MGVRRRTREFLAKEGVRLGRGWLRVEALDWLGVGGVFERSGWVLVLSLGDEG